MSLSGILAKLNDDKIKVLADTIPYPYSQDEFSQFITNELNKLSQEKIASIENQFPHTININKWCDFFNTNQLNSQTRRLFYHVKREKYQNLHLQKIFQQFKSHNLEMYTAQFTPEDGNCLFHVLVENGIGKDATSLRRGIAYILHVFKDQKNFFDNPDMSSTFEELFTNFNEVEIVRLVKENKAYKFDYNLMIYDIAGDTNFSTALTELLLLIISQLYKVEFKIFHDGNEGTDTGYITSLSAWEHLKDTDKNNIRTVYMAQIGELHYFSIMKVPDEIIKRKNILLSKQDRTDEESAELLQIKKKYRLREHTKNQIKFLEWGKNQAIMKYIINEACTYYEKNFKIKYTKSINDNDTNNDDDAHQKKDIRTFTPINHSAE